jgi:hypothetical protein
LTAEAIVGGVPERWTSKAVRYWPDPTRFLERASKRFIERDFPALQFITMGFVWKNPFGRAGDQCPIPATYRLLNKRDRDVFGVDVIFELDPQAFVKLPLRDQYRAVYHLLRHLSVGTTDDLRPERDATGRVLISLERHDLHIRSFKDEVRRFGGHQSYTDVVEFLEQFNGAAEPAPEAPTEEEA